MGLELVPIELDDANLFVDSTHRHHQHPPRARFAVAAARDGVLVAVAIIANPVARALADGWSVEVTRLASVGGADAFNACSMLYRAAWRSARARGFRRALTYTRSDELGASLRAAGWVRASGSRARSWDTPSRRRDDSTEPFDRHRWEILGADYVAGLPVPRVRRPDGGQLEAELG